MIKIVTEDIYLRFPEIMEEEFEDLTEFIEDNHIRYEGATDVVYNLKKENANLKQALNETIEFGNYLLENNEIEIDNKKYYKHSCDDIITKEILKRLDKVRGE